MRSRIWILPRLAAPKRPPDFSGIRPAIAEGGLISHTETVELDLSLEQFQEWLAQNPLESMVQGTQDMPPVMRTEMVSGVWGQPGARRRVILRDGHQAVQEILEWNWPSSMKYELWGFTNEGRYLSDYAVGDIRITEVSGRSCVKWTYAFHKRCWFVHPILSHFVHTYWAKFMRAGLDAIRKGAERNFAAHDAGSEPISSALHE